MSIENTLERLYRATLALCQDGAIKDRLVAAYTAQLMQLDLEHLPATLRAEFSALRDALNRAPELPRENVVRASIRKLSTNEANQYAQLIVRLYAGVAREQRRDNRAARRAMRSVSTPLSLVKLAGETGAAITVKEKSVRRSNAVN
jgi:hypothetical protein